MSLSTTSERVSVKSSVAYDEYIDYKGNKLLVLAKGKVSGLSKTHIGTLPKGLRLTK